MLLPYFWRIKMTKEKLEPILYMVVDVTDIETTKIRFVTNNERAVLLGQIYINEHPGRKCIAPIVEARSFSKLDKLALQYLFWNTFAEKPNEDYAQLLQDCLTHTLKLEVDTSEIGALQALQDLSTTNNPVTVDGVPKAPKVKKEPTANAVPKTTSTCGLVWVLCAKVYKDSGLSLEDKTLRGLVMAACEEEGVNKSTAAVQWGKWRASVQVSS